MTFPLEQLILNAEGRYFKPEEIQQIQEFLAAWPQRTQAYRLIRDQEEMLVQETLTLLKGEVITLNGRTVELCEQDLRLVLRHCSLAMLMEDSELVKERLIEWLEEQARLYDLSSTYEKALRLLQNTLKKHLPGNVVDGLRPYLTQVQVALIF